MIRKLNPLVQHARALSMAKKVSPVKRVSTAAATKPQTTSKVSAASTSENEPKETPSETVNVSLKDSPIVSLPQDRGHIDWSDSFHGLGLQPFSKETSDILLAPIANEDIEIKPDGLLYLPEIKYRRILNKAFGPGGWGLAPRTETLITPKQVSREYALICNGRLVSVSRGEQDYFGGTEKLTTALEGAKSNALMRCCKDLGVASELWDPSFIRKWKKKYCDEAFCEHIPSKKKKKLWKLKSNNFEYPYKAC